MSQLVRDILLALIAGLPALLLAIVALRKMPAEVNAAEAAADKAQHDATRSIAESADILSKSLSTEVEKLKTELAMSESRADAAQKLVAELQQRLASAEDRLARAESRAADAEKRASEFRTELIKVGTMLDQSRREHQHQIDELVLVIQTLLEQVEQLGGKPNIDRELLDRIANLSRNGGKSDRPQRS